MNIYTPEQQLEINTHMSRYGYVVVNVMSAKRASIFLKQLQTFLKVQEIPESLMPQGLIKSHGIGQSEVLWNIRRVRTIKNVFATLCKCKPKHLLPSFDGACYMSSNNGDTKMWPHRDQRPTNNNIDTFQGSLCLAESDGGFMCWPKSHLIDDWDTTGAEDVDYFNVTFNTHSLVTEKKAKKICPPPGSLIVWDSRLIHCNFRPTLIFPRAVAFVCMVDGRNASEEVLSKREFCMQNNKTTSHHPLRFRINES
jgi:hypothetical protein